MGFFTGISNAFDALFNGPNQATKDARAQNNPWNLLPLLKPPQATPTITDAADRLAQQKRFSTLLTAGSRRSTFLTAGNPWPYAADGSTTPPTGKASSPTASPPGTKVPLGA
jgi:hypothetical protein